MKNPPRIQRPKPRAQAVADSLREFVKRQRLVPGDRLPSEAELVRTLGVGRSSVREGVQLLESLGIVHVEHGRGMFLAPAMGSALREVVDWAYVSRDRDRLLYDLLEARVVVEPMQARFAAERATEAEIQHLIEAFPPGGINDSDDLSLSEGEAVGIDYHHYIGRIAHNEILLIMSNAVRPLYLSLVGGLDRKPSEFASLLGHHDRVTKAIASRNPDGAARAMSEHLRSNQEMVERWIARRDRSGNRRRPSGVEEEFVD
jgi:GntR family transcriptional repressor for pyruvate dehydrogenase complex